LDHNRSYETKFSNIEFNVKNKINININDNKNDKLKISQTNKTGIYYNI